MSAFPSVRRRMTVWVSLADDISDNEPRYRSAVVWSGRVVSSFAREFCGIPFSSLVMLLLDNFEQDWAELSKAIDLLVLVLMLLLMLLLPNVVVAVVVPDLLTPLM